MRIRGSIVAVAAAGMLVAGVPLQAGDWPQYRGPNRDGKSPETGLLQEWPETGPPLAWKAAGLGAGYSSVSVAAGRVYTMGDLGDGQYAIAVDDGSGEILWKTKVGETHKDQYLGPRSTPTVDGKRIYLETTGGDVFCLAAGDGAVVWKRNLYEDFGGALMQAMGKYDWRYSESPLIDGDRVIVTPGSNTALLVALDKSTGEEIWRTDAGTLDGKGLDGAGYSSPVVAEIHGVRQYVQLLGRGVVGVAASDGKLLWRYANVANEVANISVPIVHGNQVFASTGYGTGSGLVRIEKDGDAFRAVEVYFLEANTMQNHHGEMILHDGVVYTGTGHNKGLPIAVDMSTGKPVWGPERNKGAASASVTYADGRLYFRYQDGRMYLIDATPEGYRERGSFQIPDVEHESWANPVVANGKLYLREQDNLLVYELRQARTKPTADGS